MDEAGQTGQNLLDPAQPVFTLGSVDLDDSEAAELVGTSEHELHFVRAKRQRQGRARVVELLSSLPAERVRTVVIHKSFMVTCKMIDQLVEPMLHDRGVDGYADGSIPALANLWHHTLDAAVGPTALFDLQRLFVEAVRDCTYSTLDAFYLRLGESVAASKIEIPAMREMWSDSRPHFAALMEDQALPVLDPGVPAVQSLIYDWARTHQNGFEIRHDRRNGLHGWIRHYSRYFDAGQPPAEFRFPDGVTIRLPVPVTAFGTSDSGAHPAIQVADVVASATTYVLRGRITEQPDAFAEALIATPLLGFITMGSVWPDSDILENPQRPAPSGEFDRMNRWLLDTGG